METARPIEQEPLNERPAHPTAPASPPLRKNPLLAATLGLFPGVGHIYDGLYLRGVIFFSLVASLIALGNSDDGDHGVLGFVVAFVWIFNVIDSVRQAQLINIGRAQDLGIEDAPKAPKASQGGLFAGLLFLALGVMASLQVFFDVELSWMLHYWPLALLAMGAWLTVAWFRERKKGEEPAEPSKLF